METCTDCEPTKEFPSQQSLNMHRRWNHNPDTRARLMKAARKTARTKIRRNKLAQRSGAAPKKYARRKYRAREAEGKIHGMNGTATTYQDKVVACPRCGCNIEAVRIAMSFKE